MKAESAIFTGIQKPLSIYGLSPYLAILVFMVGGVSFGVLVVIGYIEIALVVAVALIVSGWVSFYRKSQADHHYASFLFLTPAFWRQRKHKTLIAGQPSLTTEKEKA
ncbi:MAG: hypothetical protein HQL35_09495 [Alphaproteobacteria bacterium]|nr:hypothetical protein [Alphaproteobacteria bacterium]